MIANLTTPLIGVVSTTAIGRLGDATLLGGVAMASVIFDCLFWLFAFVRMSTLAFTAQSLGAGETGELHVILLRGLIVAGIVGLAMIALQIPLAALLFGAMGGSEGVMRAASRSRELGALVPRLAVPVIILIAASKEPRNGVARVATLPTGTVLPVFCNRPAMISPPIEWPIRLTLGAAAQASSW